MAEIKLDYGLNIATKAPVDKRMVVDKLSDLYTKSTFDYVYAGLVVSVLNSEETAVEDPETHEITYTYNTGKVTLWQLTNVEPYNFGSTIELNRDNFKQYWQEIGAGNSSETSNNIAWDDLDLDE